MAFLAFYDSQLGAGVVKSARDGRAQVPRGAGDHGYFSSEVVHGFSSCDLD
jgi:hypothetical protein